MEQTQNGGSPHALSTAVVVLKPKPGGRGETLRMRGFELRHEADHRRLVLHRNGTDVGQFDTDQLEGWHMECQ